MVTAQVQSRPSGVVLVIVDGLSDTAPHLSNAHIPTLDRAARRGRVGLLDPVQPALACGSDTAHLSMFGYAPLDCYRGRGAFEAMGAGMPMLPGDVAFKCNFGWVDREDVVRRRCAGRGDDMERVARQLVDEVDGIIVDGIQVAVLYAGEHRCVIRLRGSGLSDSVSNTDPMVDGGKLLESIPLEKGAEKCARVVNKASRRFRDVLERCDTNVLGKIRPGANVVLMRGAAERISVQTFFERHGISAFLIAPTKIINGVGCTVGLDILTVKGATGGFDTDLSAKGRTCVEAMMMPGERERWKWALGIVHIKAVDEAGHEQDGEKKITWLEKIDTMIADMMHSLLARGRSDVVFVVTGDHTTPTAFGDHTCEPVPVVFVDTFDVDDEANSPPVFVPSDDCATFDEISAGMYGSLGRFPGSEFMGLIKRLLHTAS